METKTSIVIIKRRVSEKNRWNLHQKTVEHKRLAHPPEQQELLQRQVNQILGKHLKSIKLDQGQTHT